MSNLPTPRPILSPPPVVRQPMPVTTPKRTQHGFHLCMTVLTAGLWVPVWIVCAILNAGKTTTIWVTPS